MKAELVAKAVQSLKGGAQLLIEMAKKEHATKDGYGMVMGYLSEFKPHQQALLLLALREYGYPHDTLETLVGIMGSDTEKFYSLYSSLLHVRVS